MTRTGTAEAPVPEPDDGPPPFASSWRRLYSAVLIYLVVLIAVLYLITRHFK